MEHKSIQTREISNMLISTPRRPAGPEREFPDSKVCFNFFKTRSESSLIQAVSSVSKVDDTLNVVTIKKKHVSTLFTLLIL
jgi:hypothetical protein